MYGSFSACFFECAFRCLRPNCAFAVAGRLPPAAGLAALFDRTAARAPDLVVVALQHVPDAPSLLGRSVAAAVASALPSASSASSSSASSSAAAGAAAAQAEAEAAANPALAWTNALLAALGRDEYVEIVTTAAAAAAATAAEAHERSDVETEAAALASVSAAAQV